MSRLSVVHVALLLGLIGCSSNEPAKVPTGTPSSAVADISGIWHMVADTPSGQHEATMFVEQTQRAVSGRFEGALGVMHFTGTIDAPNIQFSHPAMAGSMHFDYRGTLQPSAMEGTAVFGTLGTGRWRATRVANQ